MKLRYCFLPIGILLASSPVYAAGGYLGLGLGQAEIRQGFFGEYGDGYKIFGGVRLHHHLAIEAAYLDFGHPSENLFGVQTKYTSSAFGLWAKGLWPVKRTINLYAKAGLAHWKIDKTTTVFGSSPSKTSTSGSNFAWGAGVAFNSWKRFSLQLEYEDINSDLDTITLWSVAGIYRF